MAEHQENPIEKEKTTAETQPQPAQAEKDSGAAKPKDSQPQGGAPETFWQKYKRKQAEKKAKQKKKTVGQEILSWVYTILGAVLIAMMIRMFVGEAIRVDGESMTNTLQDGEIVLVSKMAYLFGDIERNDIVICRYPNRETWQVDFGASMSLKGYTLFVKRVVALPGDTVQIKDGKLYVNREEVPDPEFMGSVPGNYGPRTLGTDEYFVIGDNRGNSHDSRAGDVGPLHRSQIMGKVTRVLIPWRTVE